ncbi:MAG: hypothetical protein GY922_02230 [Proteobacteria bacterium]|jgi:hypothetical protein|nr:hypothetical protein [Pseudomonadota bacterium]
MAIRATRQRTFEVNGERVTIITKMKTVAGNFDGWYVDVNGQRFKIRRFMDWDEAEEEGFSRWLKVTQSHDCWEHQEQHQSDGIDDASQCSVCSKCGRLLTVS